MRLLRFALGTVAVALFAVLVHGEELPAHALARLGTTGVLCGDTFAAVAVSGDGKYLASGGSGCALRVWELVTGKGIEVPETLEPYPTSLAFLSDNKTLLRLGSRNDLRPNLRGSATHPSTSRPQAPSLLPVP